MKCHLIFVCKYRKQLLLSDIRDCVISVFKEVESKCDFGIEIMETDRDHIHLLINYPPNITVTSIVRILKQVSTNRLWKEFQPMLRKHFWKEHTFWSDGYFVCSIGEANLDTIIKKSGSIPSYRYESLLIFYVQRTISFKIIHGILLHSCRTR